MENEWRLNIQQGWRHHANLPLPGVQNSHPALSKKWREYVQQRNGLGSNDILMKKINVLIGTNGVSWTILDDWQYIVYKESKGHIV